MDDGTAVWMDDGTAVWPVAGNCPGLAGGAAGEEEGGDGWNRTSSGFGKDEGGIKSEMKKEKI